MGSKFDPPTPLPGHCGLFQRLNANYTKFRLFVLILICHFYSIYILGDFTPSPITKKPAIHSDAHNKEINNTCTDNAGSMPPQADNNSSQTVKRHMKIFLKG